MTDLKSARLTLGLSQSEMAAALGMKSARSIRRMEKGEVAIGLRTQLAVSNLLEDHRKDGKQ